VDELVKQLIAASAQPLSQLGRGLEPRERRARRDLARQLTDPGRRTHRRRG